MLKVLTFNAAILDVRIFGHSFHRPVDYIDARLAALVDALRESDADIVFLQELFHHRYQQELCQQLRRHFPYSRGHCRSGWKLRLGNELLTLSKYPLGEGELQRFKQAPAEELRHTSKGFYHCTVTLPELGVLHLVNFHLSAGGKHQHPESPAMEALRTQQLTQLLAYTRTLPRTLLGGDLNAGTEVSAVNYQQVLQAAYIDLFAVQGAEGMSWDPANPLVMAGSDAHLPAQRIDHIFAAPALAEELSLINAEIAFCEHRVPVDAGWVPLSDHYAVAVEMQAGPVCSA